MARERTQQRKRPGGPAGQVKRRNCFFCKEKIEEISRVLKITDGVMRHLAVRRVQGGTTRPPEPAPEERVAVAAPARQDSSETETAPGEESE